MKKFLTLLALVALAVLPSVAQAQDSVLNPTVDTSVEAKQARAATRVLTASKSGYSQLLRLQKEGIELVWKSRDGLTPQQVCDGLGTKAGKIFAIHAALTDALIAAQQADGIAINVALPTNAFTINPNGTVTISEAPYVPPSQ